jgi:hypothetical protein
MWATDKAIGMITESGLVELVSDQSARDAMVLGALFPDTGYAIDAPYGEPAHWEPFATASIDYLKKNFIPADTVEKKKVVAFFLGAFTHGIEDEVFDTLFITASEQHDGVGQEFLDMNLDAFLIADGHATPKPPIFLPATDAVAIFTNMGVPSTVEQMQAGMDKTVNFAVDGLRAIAKEVAAGSRSKAPWTAKHYLDPNVGGTFSMESVVVARFLDFSWRRLTDTSVANGIYVSKFPDDGQGIRSLKTGDQESWMSIFTGEGIDDRDITKDRIRLYSAGTEIAADISRNRWSSGNGESRLFVVKPATDLVADSEYTVEVASGTRLYDGRATDQKFTATFTTRAPKDGGTGDGGAVSDGGADGGGHSGSTGCSCAVIGLE